MYSYSEVLVLRLVQTLRIQVRNLPSPCYVFEQDTLLPEITGNTQEEVGPSRHDRKIVDWDVKPKLKPETHL